MPGFALKTVIIVIVIALIVIVIARMFHRPTPVSAQDRPAAQRIPLLAKVSAAVLLAAAFILALVSFASRFTEHLLLMRIAAVAALLASGAVLFFASRRARRR